MGKFGKWFPGNHFPGNKHTLECWRKSEREYRTLLQQTIIPPSLHPSLQ